MRRRLFPLLSLTSLLLGAAAAVLWARSYWVCDYVLHRHLSGPSDSVEVSFYAQSNLGRVRLGYAEFMQSATDGKPLPWHRLTYSYHRRSLPAQTTLDYGWRALSFDRHWHGFNWDKGVRTERRRGAGGTYRDEYVQLFVPYWCLVVAFALPPALWLCGHVRRRRRRRLHLCPCCGYDLRASPGRCPECGMEAARVPGEEGGQPQPAVAD